MGREIRRVPPNWEHPRYTKENVPYGSENPDLQVGCYVALFNQSFDDAVAEWKEEFALWEAGTHEDIKKFDLDGQEYWEWFSPPSREAHLPTFQEEPTWFQVYETVSEGTPVTPPFATLEELGDYLRKNGDSWDQARGTRPSSEAVDRFLQEGVAITGAYLPGVGVVGSYETLTLADDE